MPGGNAEPAERRTSSKKGWLGCLGIIVLLIIIGAIFGPSPSSNNSSPSSGRSTSHKSARELITERARQIHPNADDITVDGGFYGGAYQVTVLANFHSYVYAVEVDENAQRITAWELRNSH
jgi:hypothetical protein